MFKRTLAMAYGFGSYVVFLGVFLHAIGFMRGSLAPEGDLRRLFLPAGRTGEHPADGRASRPQ